KGRVIDKAGHNSGLIPYLVQMAMALADCCCRNLSDDRQHRRVHSICSQQSSARIEKAWSRNDRVSLWFAGRKRGAECHISSARLVAGVDHAQVFRGALEGIEQMIVVDARQRIDSVEPVGDQGRYRRFGGRHFGHRRPSLRRLFSGFGHEDPVAQNQLCRPQATVSRRLSKSNFSKLVALTKPTPHALFPRFILRFSLHPLQAQSSDNASLSLPYLRRTSRERYRQGRAALGLVSPHPRSRRRSFY